MQYSNTTIVAHYINTTQLYKGTTLENTRRGTRRRLSITENKKPFSMLNFVVLYLVFFFKWFSLHFFFLELTKPLILRLDRLQYILETFKYFSLD